MVTRFTTRAAPYAAWCYRNAPGLATSVATLFLPGLSLHLLLSNYGYHVHGPGRSKILSWIAGCRIVVPSTEVSTPISNLFIYWIVSIDNEFKLSGCTTLVTHHGSPDVTLSAPPPQAPIPIIYIQTKLQDWTANDGTRIARLCIPIIIVVIVTVAATVSVLKLA